MVTASMIRWIMAGSDILAHVNADHAEAVGLIAERLPGGAAGAWRMAAVDVDGCDLSDGNRTVRLAFPAPVRDAGDVRAALVRAVGEARSRPD